MIGTFRIGEDIRIALDAVAGDAEEVAAPEAFITRSSRQNVFHPDATFTPIALTVTARAAEGDIPAGWDIVLPAAASAELKPGVYGIDARFGEGDDPIDITDETAVIWLTPSAVPLG